MFGGGRDIIGNLTGGLKHVHLKGSVVLMRKNALDFNDLGATVMDSVGEFLGRGVTCQLISSTVADPSEQNTHLKSFFLDRRHSVSGFIKLIKPQRSQHTHLNSLSKKNALCVM